MTPMKLVNLWRQRWGVGGRFLPAHEFSRFYVSDTVQDYVVGDLTAYGGPVSVFLAVAGVLMFVATTVVQQTVFDQLFFAVAMILIALGVRRLAGRMAFLIVSGIAALMGARYLWWRLSYTMQPDMDGIPAVILFIAELFLVLAFAFHMLVSAFPFIIQAAPQMPAGDGDPYLDVIIATPEGVHPQQEQIQEWIHTLRTQQWPGERLRFFVATDSILDRATILGAGATPIVHRGPVSERSADGFNLPIPVGNGKFVFVLSSRFIPSIGRHARLIRSWVEWMERDPKLAAIHTNAHRFMPPNGESIRSIMYSPAEEYLMIRRKSWEQLPDGAPISAKGLEATGAHVATAGHAQDPGDEADLQSQMTDWIRVDTSVPESALRIRARMNAVNGVLRAGSPTAWLVVLFAVIGIPLFGYFPVNAPLSSFLAYLLPFLFLVVLAYNRAHGPLYRPLINELRDVWLSLILPPLVSLNMIVLTLRGLFSKDNPRPLLPRPEEWLALAILVGALVAAGSRWIWVEDLYLPWLVAAVLVILYLLQTLTTRWAIRNEREMLEELVTGMERQTIAIRLADGRLYRGNAMNFPTLPLRVELIADPGLSSEGIQCKLVFPDSSAQASFAGRLSAVSASGLRKFSPDAAAITKYHRFAWQSQWDIVRRVQWLPPPRLGAWLMTVLGLKRFLPTSLRTTNLDRTTA